VVSGRLLKDVTYFKVLTKDEGLFY